MCKRSAALVFTALSLVAVPAGAQDPGAVPSPRFELFVGYGGENRLDDSVLANPGWSRHLRFGADWNVTDRVALVFTMPKLAVGTSTATGTWVDYGFLAGPRIRFRQQQRVMPFVQAQVGFGRNRVGQLIVDPSSAMLVQRQSRTVLQSSIGAGFDVALSRRLAWRAIQVDERSEFDPTYGAHRLSISSGLVLRFGARK